MRRFVLVAVVAALMAALGLVPVALAAGPTITVARFTDTFHDDFLSAECGVDVTTTATGQVIDHTFEREEGVARVSSVNVGLVAQAGDRTFRFRDVGADVVQNANGTITVLISGQVPFGWTGVLKFDPATDELLLEPHWIDTSRACAALSG